MAVAVLSAFIPLANAGKTKPFKEVCSGADSSSNVSFDGSGVAGQYTAECHTNIDGPGIKSGLAQNVSSSSGSCTAPDGTTGTQYNLLNRIAVTTSNKDGSQIISISNSGVECISNTTNVYGKTENWTISGGTGRFKNATGSGTETITGQILSEPSSPGYGKFGVEQTNSTGTISW
ncbi:MAG TPA: hypothetical protein VMT58_04965 [Candidatus Binataceae bacterium]|nr:hypothetical protein [Candidatus Binataceae bacterium]